MMATGSPAYCPGRWKGGRRRNHINLPQLIYTTFQPVLCLRQSALTHMYFLDMASWAWNTQLTPRAPFTPFSSVRKRASNTLRLTKSVAPQLPVLASVFAWLYRAQVQPVSFPLPLRPAGGRIHPKSLIFWVTAIGQSPVKGNGREMLKGHDAWESISLLGYRAWRKNRGQGGREGNHLTY